MSCTTSAVEQTEPRRKATCDDVIVTYDVIYSTDSDIISPFGLKFDITS